VTDKNTRNAIAIERSIARKGDGGLVRGGAGRGVAAAATREGRSGEDGKDRGAEARRCGRGTKARDIQPYRSVYSLSGRPSQPPTPDPRPPTPPPHKLMPMYLRAAPARYTSEYYAHSAPTLFLCLLCSSSCASTPYARSGGGQRRQGGRGREWVAAAAAAVVVEAGQGETAAYLHEPHHHASLMPYRTQLSK